MLPIRPASRLIGRIGGVGESQEGLQKVCDTRSESASHEDDDPRAESAPADLQFPTAGRLMTASLPGGNRDGGMPDRNRDGSMSDRNRDIGIRHHAAAAETEDALTEANALEDLLELHECGMRVCWPPGFIPSKARCAAARSS